MGTRIYIDTNVFLDYFHGRSDNIRPLSYFAYNVFRRALDCEFYIVISDFSLKEFRNTGLKDTDVDSLLEPFFSSGKMSVVGCTKEDKDIAYRISKERGLPLGDCLHSVIALRQKCLVVTRDKHFDNLRDYVVVKLPENL